MNILNIGNNNSRGSLLGNISQSVITEERKPGRSNIELWYYYFFSAPFLRNKVTAGLLAMRRF